MMFRFGKIIESNNKSSRSDRFAEMSKQQQLIENKKQEIKAKFEERKRQETVEMQKISGIQNSIEQKSVKDHKSLISSRMQSWKNDERWRKKPHSISKNLNTSDNDCLFSNDGSFLEKYKEISEKYSETDVADQSTSYEKPVDAAAPIDERHARYHRVLSSDCRRPAQGYDPTATHFRDFNDGIPFPPPPLNVHAATSSLSVIAPQAQTLYSITSRPPPTATRAAIGAPAIRSSLAAVPASVSLISTVATPGASLQTVSLIQVPVSVSTSSVILSCPLDRTLVASEPVVHLPVVHSATLSRSSISVPMQTTTTTVIPARIQITSPTPVAQPCAQAAPMNHQPSTNVILSQTTLRTPTILLPSEATAAVAVAVTAPVTAATATATAVVPATQLPLPNTNVPPPTLAVRFSQPPAAVASNLPPVHLPPPNYAVGVAAPPQIAGRRFESTPPPPPPLNFIRNNYSQSYERLPTTSAAEERGEKQPPLSVEAGDENALREMESIAGIIAKCGDDMEHILAAKYRDDDKFWYLNEKRSPCYIAFRNMVDKKRNSADKVGSPNLKSESRFENWRQVGDNWSCNVPADIDNDDSDSEEAEGRRRRKRKRKSRWAPEYVKVEPLYVAAPPSAVDVVAPPPAVSTVVPPAVSVVAPPNKLPGTAGPLISRVTRSHPALLQYALKSFGSLNLSEDDWKKAEDHYKINLLYQDMLKKRQELEKLQAAGKNKYAYDSDEDTEGGTWEHKLRQQEMVATRLWADELTERSKDRHHIGDFLPPDELKRFMEKYDALKQGREPDLSDYKEFKLREDNIGFQMLQKLGWTEGQGLGSDGSGIVNPVNKAPSYATSHGLGIEKPDALSQEDDEYDTYRKRMMLAYRFRPNPLNNPRRPYY